MSNRRDLFILGALVVTLFALVVLWPTSNDDSQPSIPTTYSAGPMGAQALLRWSQELGYNAQRLEYRSFTLTENDSVLIVLNPSERFNRTEADEVLNWVEEGGTLLLVDSQSGLFGNTDPLLKALDVEKQPVEAEGGIVQQATPAQPFFDQPSVATVEVQASHFWRFERGDYATLLGTETAPLLVGLHQGAGYVYLATTIIPFTNEGLRNANSAALTLNLFERFPTEGRILFDEYHHGHFAPPSLRSVIFSQPWGWGLICTLTIIGLYLILTGRRFGQPVPLREEVALRSSAEYIESMADLFQRGGKRTYIGLHYHTALKRRLARPFGINPRLDDEIFIRELGRFHTVDAAQLTAILATLRRRELREEELVQTVALADAFATR